MGGSLGMRLYSKHGTEKEIRAGDRQASYHAVQLTYSINYKFVIQPYDMNTFTLDTWNVHCIT